MILKNSLSGKLEDFIPIDCDDVKMYVCGPTIYNSPHVGNARSLIVFDFCKFFIASFNDFIFILSPFNFLIF